MAPRGKTPLHHAWDRRDKISAISAITISPKRKRLGFYFHLLPDDDNVRGDNVVAFLRQLKCHMPGPITIVWDRSSTHDRAKVVRRYLARHPEIVTEKFPGYAPELNPDEQVWSYSKYGRMANYAPVDTNALRKRITKELKRLKKRPNLLASFIKHSKLPLRL